MFFYIDICFSICKNIALIRNELRREITIENDQFYSRKVCGYLIHFWSESDI